MKYALFIVLLGSILQGCFQAHSEDNFSTVPATNNPHILPSSAQTAQIPSFGN